MSEQEANQIKLKLILLSARLNEIGTPEQNIQEVLEIIDFINGAFHSEKEAA